jgi:hypothetical protein
VSSINNFSGTRAEGAESDRSRICHAGSQAEYFSVPYFSARQKRSRKMEERKMTNVKAEKWLAEKWRT